MLQRQRVVPLTPTYNFQSFLPHRLIHSWSVTLVKFLAGNYCGQRGGGKEKEKPVLLLEFTSYKVPDKRALCVTVTDCTDLELKRWFFFRYCIKLRKPFHLCSVRDHLPHRIYSFSSDYEKNLWIFWWLHSALSAEESHYRLKRCGCFVSFWNCWTINVQEGSARLQLTGSEKTDSYCFSGMKMGEAWNVAAASVLSSDRQQICRTGIFDPESILWCPTEMNSLDKLLCKFAGFFSTVLIFWKICLQLLFFCPWHI